MKRLLTALGLLCVLASSLAARGLYERVFGPMVGDGDMQTRDVAVAVFTSVHVSSGIALQIVQGDRHAVRVIARPNMQDRVIADTEGTALVLRIRPGLFGTGPVTVAIQMPALERLEASGGSPVSLGPGVAARTFQAQFSGGASLKGGLNATQASLSVSGGSGVDLAGACGDLILDASGGGRMLLESLEVATARVSLSGGAHARIHVTDRLEVEVSGGSRLWYHGDPRLDLDRVSGGASVERI